MGYKKQSKRKSPFKAYGRSQKNAVRFDELTDAQNNRNLLGQAVGAIGTSIGDAVSEFEANKENEQAASTANPGATAETNKAAAAAFGSTEVNVPINAPNFEAETLKGINAPKPRAAGATKSYAQVGADAFQKAINEGKSPQEAAKIQSTAISDSKAWNKKQHGTENPTDAGKTNNIVQAKYDITGGYVAGSVAPTDGSTADPSPENSTRFSGVGQYSGPFNRSPLKRMTPFLRSPFYATKGKKLGELAQSSLTNLSYLGQAGQAGAEGYNSQVDRHNYAQAVREEQAAELDEEFGELAVEPTGFKPYDASVEGLAREWKTEFVDAKKAWKAGKLSNEDWIDTKHRLQGNAASYGKAAGNLQQSMKNWIDNKGQISDSTKPETIDFFNTMEKAPDSLTVQNIDGVPTFVGETLGGKPISMPVDQIANGTAAMRFNTKIDLGKELQPTIKEIQGIKTEIETSRGVGTGNLPFDTPAIQQRVNFALDKIVNNNAKLRSIASDTYGWDYDDFEERVEAEGMDGVKELIKDELRNDIQESYFPTQVTTRFTQDEQQQQQKIDNTAAREARLAQGGSTQTPQGRRNYENKINNIINKPGGIDQIKQQLPEGYKIGIDPKTSKVLIGKVGVDEDGNETVTKITGDPYAWLSQQTPINRSDESALKRSPFRRIMDFFKTTK